MNKNEIENHKGWKYISSLTPKERFFALAGSNQEAIKKCYDVDIQFWPYTSLPEVKENYVAIAVTDGYMNISQIAVLIPNSEVF